MKKITLLTTLLLITSVTLAQQNRTEFGLKGGVNLANLENTANTESRTGFNVGALAHFHVSPRFALQPELQFSTQGAKMNNGGTHENNYINLPLMGQVMFGEGFRLQTGPKIGYLVSSKADSGNNKTDLDNIYEKTDFSWSVGAGYLTRNGLGFDARYNIGLNDISQNNNDVKNRVWQIGLFYQFRK